MLTEPTIFPFEGTDYHVWGLTQQVQDMYAKYVEAKSFALIMQAKSALPADDYLALLRDHLFKAAHNGYGFGSETCTLFLQEPQHFTKLLWMLLVKHHTTITEAEVKALVEKDPEAWVQLLTQVGTSKKNCPEDSSGDSLASSQLQSCGT